MCHKRIIEGRLNLFFASWHRQGISGLELICAPGATGRQGKALKVPELQNTAQ